MAEQDFTQDVVGNGEFGESENGTAATVKAEIKEEAAEPAATATSEASTNESNGTSGIPKGADDNTAEDRKLFIGGLSWETREPQLKSYFEAYGEVESVNLKLNPMTGRYDLFGRQSKLSKSKFLEFRVKMQSFACSFCNTVCFVFRSRCFAFVVFKEAESINKVFEADGGHAINSKKVDVKRAKAKPGKMFLGGLKPELSDDDIRTHFEQYGTIIEFEMPYDKTKNQRKGFGFITFEREETMKELIKKGKEMIGEYSIDLKKATPRPDNFHQGVVGGGAAAPWAAGAGDYAGYNDYYGYSGYQDYNYSWGPPQGSYGWGPYGGGGKMRGRGRGRGGRSQPY